MRWPSGIECSLLATSVSAAWNARIAKNGRINSSKPETRKPKPRADPVTEATEGEEHTEGLVGGAVPACAPAFNFNPQLQPASGPSASDSALQPKPSTSTGRLAGAVSGVDGRENLEGEPPREPRESPPICVQRFGKTVTEDTEGKEHTERFVGGAGVPACVPPFNFNRLADRLRPRPPVATFARASASSDSALQPKP